jgi:hypothetical protein
VAASPLWGGAVQTGGQGNLAQRTERGFGNLDATNAKDSFASSPAHRQDQAYLLERVSVPLGHQSIRVTERHYGPGREADARKEGPNANEGYARGSRNKAAKQWAHFQAD